MISDLRLKNFRHPNLFSWMLKEEHSFGIDLTPFQSSDPKFIDGLSKNTRYQIRRSLRLYEERGELEFRVAQSAEEASLFLSEAGKYHQLRWGGEGDQSVLEGSAYSDFHNSLIKKAFPRDEVMVIKISAGDILVGYIYNFLYCGTVNFYQCAFNYEEDKKKKPGLVSHHLCIENYISDGLEYYDFLAGESQYKKSLGRQADPMFDLLICRRTPKLRFLSFLRDCQSRLRGIVLIVQGKVNETGS